MKRMGEGDGESFYEYTNKAERRENIGVKDWNLPFLILRHYKFEVQA